MSYALDTNTISYAIRGEGKVRDKLRSQPFGAVALPSLVLWELYAWRDAPKTTRAVRTLIETIIAPLPVLDLDAAAVRAASAVRLALQARGRLIGAIDILIAGTALAHSATLVTRNKRHLSRVPGLTVEDWYA